MLSSVRFLSILLLASLACAQSQELAARPSSSADIRGAGRTVAPVVSFTLDFPKSQPENYSIRVPSEGLAHYQSTGRISRDSEDTDSFEFDFVLSQEMRGKMFRLAGDAGHFQHDLDAHLKNLAFTGKKTLSYQDAQRTGEATFNYTGNPAARELTELFQSLSTTLEFGHRLDYDHRYQKLALNEELQRMQEMAQGKTLVEVSAIQPILERIVADHSVMNVARARAQQLLGSTK